MRSSSVSRASRAPGQAIDLGARACLALDAACRTVFRPETPDIFSASYEDGYFEHEASKGRALLRRFGPLAERDVLDLGCGYGGLTQALLEAGARPVGVDVDERRVAFATRKLEGTPAQILAGDAACLPLPDESVDVIVSDAVLEHLPDLARAFAEGRRVLRRGGRFCARWGPAWLTYNGPHLIKCLAIPWVHLLFPDAVIVQALEQLKREHDRIPASYLDYKIQDFRAMGRLTRRKLRMEAKAAGFELVDESSRSRGPLKQVLSQVPPFDELLAGELIVVLRKP